MAVEAAAAVRHAGLQLQELSLRSGGLQVGRGEEGVGVGDVLCGDGVPHVLQAGEGGAGGRRLGQSVMVTEPAGASGQGS